MREERTGATVEWPSWSPDGTRLAYTKSVFGYRTERLEEVDLATALQVVDMSGRTGDNAWLTALPGAGPMSWGL